MLKIYTKWLCFLAAVMLLVFASVCSAQTYGTWGAPQVSYSTTNPSLSSVYFTSSMISNVTYTNTLGASHGHPVKGGFYPGDACIKSQPITIRYYYLVTAERKGTGLVGRLDFKKQQCL
jgi:hypothetical protein